MMMMMMMVMMMMMMNKNKKKMNKKKKKNKKNEKKRRTVWILVAERVSFRQGVSQGWSYLNMCMQYILTSKLHIKFAVSLSLYTDTGSTCPDTYTLTPHIRQGSWFDSTGI